jgi:hypothetical protein
MAVISGPAPSNQPMSVNSVPADIPFDDIASDEFLDDDDLETLVGATHGAPSVCGDAQDADDIDSTVPISQAELDLLREGLIVERKHIEAEEDGEEAEDDEEDDDAVCPERRNYPLFDDLTSVDWDSQEEALEAVQDVAETYGFAVVKLRTGGSKIPGTSNPVRYSHIDLICGRGQPAGEGTRKKAAGRISATPRVRTKRSCGCQWQSYISTNRASKYMRWTFTTKNLEHNHLPDDLASHMPAHRRRRLTQQVRTTILELSLMPRVTSGDIAARIRSLHGSQITAMDVRNILGHHQRQEMGIRTAFQHFLRKLTDDPNNVGPYIRRARADGPATAILWTNKAALALWKQFPEVWTLDCTYCVNKYNWPLCNIVGITNLGSTFNIAWCVLNGETEEDFSWLFQQLEDVRTSNEIEKPFVLMTDIDHACKNAAKAVLGDDVKQQVCLWHVLKNIVHNVKKKWVGSLDGTAIGDSGSVKGSKIANVANAGVELGGVSFADMRRALQDEGGNAVTSALLHEDDRLQHLDTSGIRDPRLNPIVQQLGDATTSPGTTDRKYKATGDGIVAALRDFFYADTRDDGMAVWDAILTEFPEQPAIIAYVRKHYRPLDEEICTWAIKSHRNFGTRASSRAEAAHWLIKQNLPGRNIHLLALYIQIDEAQKRSLHRYNNKLSAQRNQQYTCYNLSNVAIFQLIRGRFSFRAMKLMEDQVELATSAQAEGRDPNACSGNFSLQYGLPCWHKLFKRFWNEEDPRKSISLEMIDHRWRLHRPEVCTALVYSTRFHRF